MEINLTVRPGDCYSVLVNGKIVCEGVGDTPEDGSKLTAQIRAARANNALRTIVSLAIDEARRCVNLEAEGMKPEAKRDAYARGLRDGLLAVTVPHPFPGVPPIEPEHSRPYRQGYETGESLRRAATIAKTLD